MNAKDLADSARLSSVLAAQNDSIAKRHEYAALSADKTLTPAEKKRKTALAKELDIPATEKIKKGKKLDEILKKAMQRIIDGEMELEPEVIAAKAVEIVKPFVEKVEKPKKQEKYVIDWASLEKDAKRVQELLRLWQEQVLLQDDEDILLLSEG